MLVNWNRRDNHLLALLRQFLCNTVHRRHHLQHRLAVRNRLRHVVVIAERLLAVVLRHPVLRRAVVITEFPPLAAVRVVYHLRLVIRHRLPIAKHRIIVAEVALVVRALIHPEEAVAVAPILQGEAVAVVAALQRDANVSLTGYTPRRDLTNSSLWKA